MLWQTTSNISTMFSMVSEFLTGFVGAIVDVIELIFANSWLALVIIGVPVALLIFKWAKGLAKVKTK